jgi:hypothetical protein
VGEKAEEGEREPWFSLWSALAHQGGVYSASFAAVPHVVHALGTAPSKADAVHFQLPAWVEICRRKKGVEIPEDLRAEYFQAIAQLPSLVAEAAVGEWDAEFLACVLAAVAAPKGDPIVAEAALGLVPDVACDFMDWFADR